MRADPHDVACGERPARGPFPNAFRNGGVCPRALFSAGEAARFSRTRHLRITFACRVGCMASRPFADDRKVVGGVLRRAADDSARLAHHVRGGWMGGNGGMRHERGGLG